MPMRLWRHICRGRMVLEGSPRCPKCGAHGVFDRWHRGMWEAVPLYAYVYGLAPMGPHRPLADRLFAAMREHCVRCGGHTILTIDEDTWSYCPVCEGTGGIWTRPSHEVDAVRRRIVAHWPRALLPWVAR